MTTAGHCRVITVTVVRRVDPRSPHHKEKIFCSFFPSFLTLSLYEKVDVSQNSHGHHLTAYVNQTVMPYALNSQGDVCQLLLHKTGA